MGQTRNMLTESARIARGEITGLSEAAADQFDALVIPGGFGAALNLSDFAAAGRNMELRADLEQLLHAMVDGGKPVAALCIAPPILARLMQKRNVTGARLTIGTDAGAAGEIEAMGQTHVPSTPTEAVVDGTHKLVTGAAYMLAGDPAELLEGIDKAMAELLALCD